MVAIVPMKTMMFEFDTKNAPNSIVNWSLSSLPLPSFPFDLPASEAANISWFPPPQPPPPTAWSVQDRKSLYLLLRLGLGLVFLFRKILSADMFYEVMSRRLSKKSHLDSPRMIKIGMTPISPHDHLIDGPFSPRLGTGAPPHHRSQPHRQSGSHKQKAVYARALWVKKVFCPVNSSLKYNYIFPPSRRIMSPNFLLSCSTSDFRTSTGRKKGHFHFLLNILSESSETLNFVVKSI